MESYLETDKRAARRIVAWIVVIPALAYCVYIVLASTNALRHANEGRRYMNSRIGVENLTKVTDDVFSASHQEAFPSSPKAAWAAAASSLGKVQWTEETRTPKSYRVTFYVKGTSSNILSVGVEDCAGQYVYVACLISWYGRWENLECQLLLRQSQRPASVLRISFVGSAIDLMNSLFENIGCSILEPFQDEMGRFRVLIGKQSLLATRLAPLRS